MNILGMNIDWFKFLILLIAGLVIVGPEKLPSYARKAAKVIRNFEKVTKVITGQITQALDMDENEGGKTPRFKQDLMAVKRTLEADVAELKAALDSQARAITESVETGINNTPAITVKESKEINETVNIQVTELDATLQEQAKVISTKVETPTISDPLANLPEAVAETGSIQEPAQTMPQDNRETSPRPLSTHAGESEAG